MKNTQAKVIKVLYEKRDVSTFPEHLKQGLDAILGAHTLLHDSMYVTSVLANQIIDALKALPKKQGAKKAAKVIDWMDSEIQALVIKVANGEMTREQVAEITGASKYIIRVRADWYRQYGVVITPEAVKEKRKTYPSYQKKSTTGKTVTVPGDFEGITQHQIDWAGFFGLEQMEKFDLKVICAMFYAAERFVSAKKTAPELYSQKQAALRYIDTWAERFAKYTLAACAGEFRHRARKGELRFIGQGGPRVACQGTAEGVWDKGKDTTRQVITIMEHEFKEPGNFRHAYGGPKWAKIAKTLRFYLEGALPAIVFADYVWDLSHNGGRFFDKCPLFLHESEVRTMLDRKKASKTLDIMSWAGDYLHPEWKANLDILEAVNFEGGDF